MIWGTAAYIAMALSMSNTIIADPALWLVVLTLPSFVAGVAVAAVKADGGLIIPGSECQQYDANQVGRAVAYG